MGGLFYKQQMIQKGADEKTGKQKYDLNKLSLITRNIIFILHSLSLSVLGCPSADCNLYRIRYVKLYIQFVGDQKCFYLLHSYTRATISPAT